MLDHAQGEPPPRPRRIEQTAHGLPVAGERWAEACKAFGRAGPPDRVREVVAKYAAEVLAVGAAEAVAVLDLWKAGIGPDDLSDGLHFGSGGNQKTFSALQACIRGAAKRRSKRQLKSSCR